MRNAVMLGTDGREYEVVKIVDAKTGKPLEGNVVGLIAIEHLEAGLFDSSHVISFNDVPALVPTIDQMMDDPEWLKSLKTLTLFRD